MVHVYYTVCDQEWPGDISHAALAFFAVEERIKYTKFVRWQDRQAGILGKLLLMYGLKDKGIKADLSDLIFNKYGKPFFKEGPEFNITHAGDYVVCAIAEQIQLGVDIEKISVINSMEFKSVFTQEEQDLLGLHPEDKTLFYNLWTKKEAVIKAEGSGLSIPLVKINTLFNPVVLSEKHWYLQPLDISSEYKCHLATDVETEVNVLKIDYKKILP